MADSTNLKDLAYANLSAWQAKAAATQGESSGAQAAVDAAVSAAAAGTRALSAANATLAQIRAALAAIPTSADATPLLAQLDDATVAQRTAQAAVLAAERGQALARARLTRAGLDLRDAQSAVARAQSESQSVGLESARVAALKVALNAAPLATLAQAAQAVLDSTATEAKTAAEKDFPTELLDLAEARVANAASARQATADARAVLATLVLEKTMAVGGGPDRYADKQAAYDTALAALERFALTAKQRLDGAQAILTRLADPARVPAITKAESDRLNDEDQAAGRQTAADLALDLDKARHAREQAQQALDLEQARQDAGHPPAASPGDLATLKQTLADAQDTESKADTDFTADQRKLLSLWEAAAPDAAWADLADYLKAMADLNELKTPPAKALDVALTEAEAALVAARVALGKDLAAQASLAALFAQRSDEVDFDAAAAARSDFAALRGDA